ncbi:MULTISPECIES: hypothetical protein [Actinomadura]|uniref:ABM domain-containing protein n=1 Tax=Actinomadura miaoliensis TaxID=430685 RepID=A0ABP7WMS4_9ACTN
MQTVVVQYRTRPEAADENQRLIEQVFAQLAADRPDGLRYAAFRLADGVTFVHVAVVEGDANPLPEVAAFKEFQRDIAGRCAEPPSPQGASVVGAYRLPLE